LKTDAHIAALLYDHDCVIITDFGGFVASHQSAQLNGLQHTFYPPSKKIAFNASLKKNDGLLANHISTNENIPYAEACKVISEYAGECFQALSNGKKLNIHRIGLLFYDAEKNIQFIPDPHQNFLKESFGLTLVHSPALNLAEGAFPIKDIRFATRKKNKKLNWRIVELIPVAAVIALMFTFPMLTKNFDSEWSSLNPFAGKNKIEINTHPSKASSKQKLNPELVFYKPPVKKEIAKSELPATDNVSKELKDTLGNNVVLPNIVTPPSVKQPAAAVNSETNTTSALKYHVIAGCFRVEENATKFEADLKSKGFNAEILGKNKAGLTMVSISAFEHLTEAKNSLAEIQNTLNSGAWIFKSE
jgi:CCDC81-like HU domain protein/sporulation related protein